jgi:hypothetical protein
MRPSLALVSSAALLFWTVASTDSAASDSRIRVRVLGTDGAPLTAAITLVSEDDGRRLSATSSASTGAALVPAVPAGAYRLTAEAAGFPAASLDLRIAAGEVVQVAVRGGASQTVVEIVDRHRVAYGTVFDARSLEDLPGGFDVSTLPPTADPFVIGERIEGGGQYTGEPHRLGAHGSSWTQATHALGGLDVTDPDRGGTPLLQPTAVVLSSLEVTSAVAPVDVGPPGAFLKLEPRRPGAEWRGRLLGRAAVPSLQPENGTSGIPPVARLDSWRGASALVAGPLRGPNLRLLAAADTTRSARTDRDDPTLLEGQADFVFAHLVAARGTSELRLIAAHQRIESPFPGRALFADRDRRETGRLTHVQAAWSRRSAAGSVWSGTAGWQHGRRRPETGGPAGVVERLLDGPVPELASLGDQTRRRSDAAIRFAPALGGFDGGRHAVRLGATFSRATVGTRPSASPGPIAETVYGLPARVWDYGLPGPESARSRTELAGYVADRVALTDRLHVEAGLRLDVTRGRAGGAADRVRWAAVSPRASARWRAMDFARLTFFGAYGRYAHRLPLSALAFGDPAAAQGAVHRWDDRNGDGRLQPLERGALVSRVGPGGSVASIDPTLRPPRTDEVVLGLEARTRSDVVFRFAAFHRPERDLLESVNVGVTAPDYVVIGQPDPYVDFIGPADDRILRIYDRRPASFGRDRYVLTNPEDHTSLHEGFEVSLEKTAGRVRLLAGATAYRSEGKTGYRGFRVQENDQGVIGELFDDPNADTYSRGRFLFDRNYVIKIAASWRAPGDFRLGAVARYQDGQPFSRLVVVRGLAQGPEAIQAVPEGRHRFEYNLTLDVRIEKGIGLGGRRRLAAVVEAFNALNTTNSVEEDVTTRPAFRDRPTAIAQASRVVRLGLGFEF